MAAKKPVTAIKVDESLSALIGDWYNAQETAKLAVERESALRAAVYDRLYKSDDPKRSEAGTEHFGMPGGWVLKVERRINCKIDKAALDVAKKAIAELPPDPETGEVPTLDSIIRYDPKLSDAGYREAPQIVKQTLADLHVLEFNPGTPGIKLELPASAKPKATAKETE